ncbi:MAG: HAD hydrolase-like protein, partial [Pirellulaceae bacterium]|nr:HAD hydrolase-like protein [Pirellulaceae bacterium]
ERDSLMTDNIEADYRQVHDAGVATCFLTGTNIEVVGQFTPDKPPQHVLFDFDGTLSLIREGWPDVMVPMMVEYLLETETDESPEVLRDVCMKFIMELTGKQTIYQMIRLAEEIRKRGRTPLDPVEYKNEYHERLMCQIKSRREGLRNGSIDTAEMLVPGSFELLDALKERQVPVYLASGTDERYVREEVELLQLDRYFGPHVHGAVDDYKSFSKAQVIQRILANNNVDGTSLLGFGDGYVEVQNVHDVGGTAIAVASDETNRSGEPDPWKRQRLIGAGAHAVVPDFAEGARLLDWLWNSRD